MQHILLVLGGGVISAGCFVTVFVSRRQHAKQDIDAFDELDFFLPALIIAAGIAMISSALVV